MTLNFSLSKEQSAFRRSGQLFGNGRLPGSPRSVWQGKSKCQAIPVTVTSHPHKLLVLKYKPPRPLDTMQLAPRAPKRPPRTKPSSGHQKGGLRSRLREEGQGAVARAWLRGLQGLAGPAGATPPPLPFMAGSRNGRSALKKR